MLEIIKTFPRVDDPLRISMAGISYCDGSYRIKRNMASITVIEYIIKGTGYIKHNGTLYTVGADTVYILPKGTSHEYYSSANDPWEKIFINIEGDFALTILEQYGINKKIIFSGNGLKDIFTKVAEIAKSDSHGHREDCILQALFLEAVAKLSRSDGRALHSREAIILKDYLNKNLDRIIGNTELSSVIYRSPDYCVKLFRREYGVSPYDYHLSEKMRTAKRLLRDTKIPICEIAERLGYHDPCYFAGLFKKKCGTSPREYRKQNGI